MVKMRKIGEMVYWRKEEDSEWLKVVESACIAVEKGVSEGMFCCAP